MAAIRERFGATALAADGSLDRSAMRAIVFAHADARQALEAILHPMIRAESERQCRAATGPYVILAVPLLVESGSFRERCDRLCVVDCPEALQIERVKARSGLDEAQIRSIMSAQASRAQRLACADDVIDNGGSLEQLQRQVDALHGGYLAAARRGDARADGEMR
jgi:dephospho-CoA kinase